MSTAMSSYYDLVRLREEGPEAKDWAVTDKNFQVVSLILKAFESHVHTGAAPMSGPFITYTNVNASAGSTLVQLSVPYPTTLANGSVLLFGAPITNIATIAGYNPSTGQATVVWRNQPNIAYVNTVATVQVPTLTEQNIGGSLAPGVTVGIRLSYLNQAGLETNATFETDITLGLAIQPPDSPVFSSIQPFVGGLTGGTYVYVMTKATASGETISSSACPVMVPYDQTYSVTIDWDTELKNLTDGTTQYNIYRAAGLNSTFQLIGQITDATQTVFIDTNTSIDQTQQPPATSTFDQTRLVNIDWSILAGTYPADAATMNIYVTQQPGVWATQSLLKQIDLTQPTIPTSLSYLGSETLSVGWPYETNQIPAQPGPVENTIFPLQQNVDFNGMESLNFVVENSSGVPAAPSNGMLYYDTSLNNVRAYINGAWVAWGSTAITTYTHPVQEVGGHTAGNIRWVSGSGSPSVHSLLARFFDNTGASILGGRSVYLSQGVTGHAFGLTSSTTPVQLIANSPGYTGISTPPLIVFAAEYIGQPIEIHFNCQASVTGTGGYMSIYHGGVELPETRRFFGPSTGFSVSLYDAITSISTASDNVEIYYWVDSGANTFTISEWVFSVRLQV